MGRFVWAVVFVASMWASSARAAEPAAGTTDALSRKKEGHYVTGLPFVTFDSNDGVGGGARLYLFNNGNREEPGFRSWPYLYRVYLQAFVVASGSQRHAINLDVPSFLGGALRLRTSAYFTRSDNENYFGLGSAAMRGLSHPGAPGQRFSTISDYKQSAGRIYDGVTYASYHKYGVTQPGIFFTLQPRTAWGSLRPLIGAEFSHNDLRDFTGKSLSARDATGASVKAPEGTTHLRADCDAGLLKGCAGGWDNTVRVGLTYDTRDYEPNPTRGVLFDGAADVGTRALGGRYTYLRVLAAPHVFVPIGPDSWRLTAVGRAAFQWASDGAPFFALSQMPFTSGTRTGLGGLTTLRGFRQNRFVGPVATMANAELRWTFARASLGKQDLGFVVVSSADTGRVYDKPSDLKLRGWRSNFGGAFRILWNQATVIAIDAAWSAEDSGLYLNFGHPI